MSEGEAQEAVLRLGGPRVLNALGDSAVSVLRLEEIAERRHRVAQTADDQVREQIAQEAEAWRTLAAYAVTHGAERLRSIAASEVQAGACVEVDVRAGEGDPFSHGQPRTFRGKWEHSDGHCAVTDFHFNRHAFPASDITRLWIMDDATLIAGIREGDPVYVRHNGNVFRGTVSKVSTSRVLIRFKNGGHELEAWKRPTAVDEFAPIT